MHCVAPRGFGFCWLQWIGHMHECHARANLKALPGSCPAGFIHVLIGAKCAVCRYSLWMRYDGNLQYLRRDSASKYSLLWESNSTRSIDEGPVMAVVQDTGIFAIQNANKEVIWYAPIGKYFQANISASQERLQLFWFLIA